MTLMNKQVDVLLTHPANTFQIADGGVPDLEACWSACNGLDGFGHSHEDPEIVRVRSRLGHVRANLLCSPRVILSRETKQSPLMLQLWVTRSLSDVLPEGLLCVASLAAACHRFDAGYGDLDIQLIDWGSSEDRYELSIAIYGQAKVYQDLAKRYKAFMKIFDHGEWK